MAFRKKRTSCHRVWQQILWGHVLGFYEIKAENR